MSTYTRVSLSLFLLLVHVLFSCKANLAQSTPRELNHWAQMVRTELARIEDPEHEFKILANLIAVDFATGAAERANKQLKELKQRIEALEFSEDKGHAALNVMGQAQRLHEIVGILGAYGNYELALDACKDIKVSMYRHSVYLMLMYQAAKKSRIKELDQLYAAGCSDQFLKDNPLNPGDFAPSLANSYVDCLLQCGQAGKALTVFRKHEKETRIGDWSPLLRKVELARCCQTEGLIRESLQLTREVIEVLETNDQGLNFAAEYAAAHMQMARLHPQRLAAEIKACAETLENHDGTNGPAGGYRRLADDLADMGELELAIKFADKLEKGNYRQNLLRKIAVTLAKNDNTMLATQTLESLNTPDIQFQGMIDIADTMIDGGNVSSAREILDSAFSQFVDRLKNADPTAGAGDVSLSFASTQTRIGDETKTLDWLKDVKQPSARVYILLAMIQQRLQDSLN